MNPHAVVAMDLQIYTHGQYHKAFVSIPVYQLLLELEIE
jgi:hypothetical protein